VKVSEPAVCIVHLYQVDCSSITGALPPKLSVQKASLILSKIKSTLSEIINKYYDVSHVLLVGGTCRIPILQKTIKETLIYSMALYNAIDEVIQNTIDHVHRTKHLKGVNKCNEIKLN
jgi:hypothetical protein